MAGRASEAVVEEVTGPNDEGTRLERDRSVSPGRPSTTRSPSSPRMPWSRRASLTTRAAQRVPVGVLPATAEARDRIELRLFTEITDGIDAARIASEIEEELVELLGDVDVSHGGRASLGRPVQLRAVRDGRPARESRSRRWALLAKTGEGGWLAYRDDGWRCDLWWSASRDPDAILIVPEVHAAEIVFVPWSSPARQTGGGAAARRRRGSRRGVRRASYATRSRAMKKPEVPCRCGVVSRNSGRLGWANSRPLLAERLGLQARGVDDGLVLLGVDRADGVEDGPAGSGSLRGRAKQLELQAG